MGKVKGFFKKNLRYIIGGVVLAAGAVFMLIPFIPLGYILVAIGAFLLAPAIPFMAKVLDWLKRKDKKDRVEKAEGKVDHIMKNKSE